MKEAGDNVSAEGKGSSPMRRKARIMAAVAMLPAVLAILGLTSLMVPIDAERYLRVAMSGEMVDHAGKTLYPFLNGEDQWCFERGLDEVSPWLVRATLATEDQRFYEHRGVDAAAVLRAAWQNLTGRRIVSGASTLTMQVVKLKDLRDGRMTRSLPGKALQAWRALRLERAASKHDILRAYLNCAPYGMNLVGCEAASRRYFGRPARELTLEEAALLAGLPKAPTSLNPLTHPKRARERRDFVLHRMHNEGVISKDEFRRAYSRPLAARWHTLPALAPHLAMNVQAKMAEGERVETTLDATLQQAAERMIETGLERYRGDIGNAAAIVVDVPSASVLARVGSANYFDDAICGAYDACSARRSPGSALKPFTYALAMERNRLYGSEMLLDSRLDYGVYSPGNYDGEFSGLLPAADALRFSLNVPAVVVLERVGVEPFWTFLRHAGLTTLNRVPESYGLGLTLGDCEVRLDEMAAAYCMLANLGAYRPLCTIAHGALQRPETRILSTGTCLKLFEMLEQPLPGESAPGCIDANVPAPRVCWKTGTSTGHFDAWAFVFNAQYVVGVWMGNNDARMSNRLVGAETALPLAARLFRALPSGRGPSWPAPAGHLRTARVCSVSGLPASKWCPHTHEATFPQGQYLHRVCDMHYPKQGAVLASDAIIERRPGATRGWDLASIPHQRSSAPAASDNAPARRETLHILEPANQAVYVLSGEEDADRVRLHSSLDEVQSLHWYVDDRYLGQATRETPILLDLTYGDHTLACMTPTGALDRVAFTVATAGQPVHFKR